MPANTGLATLSKLGVSGSLFLGSRAPGVMAHGSTEPLLPATAAEREAWGRQGRDQIIAIARQMHIPEAIEALRRHDRFTQEVLVPKLGRYLPAAGDDHD